MKTDGPVTDTHIDDHTHWLGSRQPAKITRIAAVTGLLKVKTDRGGMRQFHRRTQSRPHSGTSMAFRWTFSPTHPTHMRSRRLLTAQTYIVLHNPQHYLQSGTAAFACHLPPVRLRSPGTERPAPLPPP